MKIFHWFLAVLLLAALLVGCSSGGSGIHRTKWKLVTLNGQDVLPDVPVSIEFGPKKEKMSGSTGCNLFKGGYTSAKKSTKMTVSPSIYTYTACSESIMKQEQAFLAALSATQSYTQQGKELVLKDASGKDLAVLNTLVQTILGGHPWVVVAVNDGYGLKSVGSGSQITALFGKKNTLSGKGACNDYTATYKAKGKKKVSIESAATTTQKDCSRQLEDQEWLYLGAVSGNFTYELSDNMLDLFSTKGILMVRYKVKPE